MPFVIIGVVVLLVFIFWDAIISFLGFLLTWVLILIGIGVAGIALFSLGAWSAARKYIHNRYSDLLAVVQEHGVYSEETHGHTQSHSNEKSPWYLEFTNAGASPLKTVEKYVQVASGTATNLLSSLKAIDNPTHKDAQNIEETIQWLARNGQSITESVDNLPAYLGDELKQTVTGQVQEMISELKEQLDRINAHLGELAKSEKKRSTELKRQNTLREEFLRVESKEADNKSRQLTVKETEADAKQRQLTQERQREEQRAKEKADELALKQQEEQRKQEKLKLEAEEIAAVKARAEADQVALKEAKKVTDIPLPYFLDFLKEKFSSLTEKELSGDNHSKLLDAYMAMNTFFKEKGLVKPERLVEVASDVKRINQIETVMDLYGEKLHRVKRDESLDEEERQMKMEYWIRLRDRDVSALEE